MKFIKENSNILVKFLLTHIVMSMLGLMIGLAILSIETETEGFSAIAVITGIFTVGFMCYLHYDDMFFFGVKEGIRLKAENITPSPFRGLVIALIGYSPVILISVVVIITALIDPELSTIPMLFFYFFQGSFIPLYALLGYVGIIGFVIITLLPAIISGALGYYIGVKDKTLRGIMGMNVKPPFDGPLERKHKNRDDNQ